MIKVAVFVSIILASFPMATADKALPPKITDYFSENREWFVTIVPTKTPDGYWDKKKWTAQQKSKLTAADTTIVRCHAMMFKKTNNCDSLVWKKDLVNRVAPVKGYVSDDGKFLVTFDNWHAAGYGPNVMAYYDANGDLIKQHSLEDISPFPVSSYSESISSRDWRLAVYFLSVNRIGICFVDENEKKEIRVYDLLKRGIE